MSGCHYVKGFGVARKARRTIVPLGSQVLMSRVPESSRCWLKHRGVLLIRALWPQPLVRGAVCDSRRFSGSWHRAAMGYAGMSSPIVD